jgi:hypothetical protein
LATVTRFTSDCGQLKLAMHPTATAKAQIAPAFRMIIEGLWRDERHRGARDRE